MVSCEGDEGDTVLAEVLAEVVVSGRNDEQAVTLSTSVALIVDDGRRP